MEKAKVLIMEDELVLAHDLEDMLHQRGYDVVGTASSGEDAIKLALATNPDLILADIKLQGILDGIDSAERISQDCDCAIVYLTARTEPDLFDKAKGTEPYGYLTKPVAPQELHRTVEMALYKHQMENRLRESEEKYRLVIENAREAIYVIQGDRIRFANPFALKLSGHSEEELYSTQYTEFIFTDDREMVRQNYLRRLRGEYAPTRYSFRIVSKRKDLIWVEVDPVTITWEGQAALLVFALDVTERKLAEDELRDSELWMKSLFEGLDEAVFVISPDRIVRDLNPAAERMFGYPKHEVVGESTEKLHISRDRYVAFGDRISQAFSAGKAALIDYEAKRKNGEVFPTEHTVSLLKAPSGDPIGISSIVRDLTERKKAEAALRDSEEAFRSIFENSLDGICLTAPDGRVFKANRAACRMLGRSEQEICEIGRDSVVDLTDPRLASALEERERRGFFLGELNCKRKDGTTFPAEISSSVYSDAKGNSRTSTIFRDITRRKLLENEKEKLLVDLTEALAQIKKLSGMLPICATCKNIRDDQGYWQQIEAYISEHSEAEFSHSICPECAKKLYPGFY